MVMSMPLPSARVSRIRRQDARGPSGFAPPVRWCRVGFAVCGGAPGLTIVRAEFVQERRGGARSKEVSPIFVNGRVLTLSRWSL